MKRFMSLMISIILVFTGFVIPATAAPGDLTFTVGTAAGNAGGDVLIPITIANNNNDLNVVAVAVTFDSTRLEWQNLGAYAPGNTATHPWIHGGFIPFLSNPGTLGANSVTFNFMDLNGVNAANGTLITLRLRVKDGAPAGDADITLSFTSVGDSRGSLNSTQYNNEAGKVTVGQVSTPNLTLSTNSWNPAAAGGSTTVSVTSNVSWTASSSAASWLSVTPASGGDNGNLTLTAQVNTGTSSRSGTITVTGGGITQTVAVTQAGASASGDLTFTVGTASGNAGADVLLPITVANNNNDLNVVAVTVTFDSTRLEWQNLGEYAPGNTATHPWIHGGFIPFLSNPGSLGANSVTFNFMDLNGVNTANGTLITLRLRVKDGAPAGDAAVTLSFTSVGDSRGSLNAAQYANEAGKVTVGSTSQDGLTFTVDSVKTRAGAYVEVPIRITNNPGISVISALRVDFNSNMLEWNYNPATYGANPNTWPFVAANLSPAYGEGIVPLSGRPQGANISSSHIVFDFMDSSEPFASHDNGVLVTLKFKVKDDVEAGATIPITITVAGVGNLTGDMFPFQIVNGAVTVQNILYGDVNQNGRVDIFDVQALLLWVNSGGSIGDIDETAGRITSAAGPPDIFDVQALLLWVNSGGDPVIGHPGPNP